MAAAGRAAIAVCVGNMAGGAAGVNNTISAIAKMVITINAIAISIVRCERLWRGPLLAGARLTAARNASMSDAVDGAGAG